MTIRTILADNTSSAASKFSVALGIAIALFVSQETAGSPLNLAQSPLFVTTGAPANIFFLADDSGSMDWNMVTTDIDGVMTLQRYHTGTAQSGSNTGTGAPRIVLANSASNTNNYYLGMMIKITGGTGAGQVRGIVGYDGGARRASVNQAWETVPDNTSTYALYTEYTYLFPQTDNVYTNDTFSLFGKVLPTEAAVLAAGVGTAVSSQAAGVWLGRYHGYNKLYYNPDINYQPWPGVDSAGNPLPNAKASSGAISVTALRLDPYLATSATYDITTNKSWTSYKVPAASTDTTVDLNISGYYPAQYYTATDSNSNGVIDAADSHTLYEIRAASGSCSSVSGMTILCPTTFLRASARTDCAVANGDGTRTCSQAEELKNFANWFMYFRRRELASKNAVATVINPSGTEVRMGYGVLNSTSTTVRREIALMDPPGNKRSLLDTVYRTQSSGGTPLRTALDKVGKYYECVNGSIFGNTSGYSCPWVSVSDGGTCQQSFAIAMTDGYYNDSFTGVGNADTDGNSPNASGNTSFDGGAYGDTYSNTLADIAMHYYERDLSSLANNVAVIPGIDTATHQHMVTYTVGFGVTGSLTAGPTNPSTPFTWPDPTTGLPQKIDDMRHAAYNGRGKFLSASAPDELANSLRSSIESIQATTGSASAVAVNSRTLTTGTVLYQARFTSQEWSGDLRAISVTPTGDIGSELWNARDVLKTQSTRTILTRRQTGITSDTSCSPDTGLNGGVPFSFTALSETQQCVLNDNPETSAFDNDGKGSARVAYLRGSTANEGASTGSFRVRNAGFKLGDITNSTPAFVGAPNDPLPNLIASVPYSSFRNDYASRRQMLYVGANDGMLHGFDANTGEERVGYVPSIVYQKLNKLTDTINYSSQHQYYVDGSPTVSDVFANFAFDGTGSGSASCASGGSCWRTVLVSGLAGGGKGVFALDVTDPDGAVPATSSLAFSESNAANIALWEFVDSTSATPNPDMGYIYGEIAISKMHNGRWAAIFGNGYNSDNENAVLYIVDIADGSVIRKIELNPYGMGSTGNSNGLSAPAAYDRDADGITDFIYAGDLRGNLWKIDVTNSNDTLWASAYMNGANPRPMFIAVDSAGVPQSITARPAVRVHPGGQAGYMVYVGTGRYVALGDKTPVASPINSFYGIWDRNVNGTTTPVIRSNLLAQSLTQTTASGKTVRIASSNAIDWSTHLGWVLNLRTDQTDSLGEMSVTNPVLLSSPPERVIFTTLISQQDICSFGGSGWVLEVSPVNGGNLGAPVFDINDDGVADQADMVGGQGVSGVNPGIGIMPEPVVVAAAPGSTQPPCYDIKLLSGSTGAVNSLKNFRLDCGGGGGGPSSTPATGRRSWRQLK